MLITSLSGNIKAKFTMPPFPPISELKIIADIIAEGKLVTFIGQRYSLNDISIAHEYAEKGHAKGKVVIKI